MSIECVMKGGMRPCQPLFSTSSLGQTRFTTAAEPQVSRSATTREATSARPFEDEQAIGRVPLLGNIRPQTLHDDIVSWHAATQHPP
jgi:hypothetical protein